MYCFIRKWNRGWLRYFFSRGMLIFVRQISLLFRLLSVWPDSLSCPKWPTTHTLLISPFEHPSYPLSPDKDRRSPISSRALSRKSQNQSEQIKRMSIKKGFRKGSYSDSNKIFFSQTSLNKMSHSKDMMVDDLSQGLKDENEFIVEVNSKLLVPFIFEFKSKVSFRGCYLGCRDILCLA